MNNETQRRIKAYKAALPELRERVIAVALLLAMSASMLASASYAWITLSTAPEVSGMATTVAANGNLEIALVDGEGNQPEKSAVGDSGAAEGKSMVDANITWGNLVNLSDPSYGLDQIALRPALLSEYNVNRYPLYGATYGRDGRVESVSDRYVYSSYKITSDGTPYFDAQNYNYGVRAISSVKVSNFTGNATYNSMSLMIDNAYTNAVTIYREMLNGTRKVDDAKVNVTAVQALTELVTLFAQEKVNEIADINEKSDYSGSVRYLYNMMLIVRDVLQEEGKALLLMANLQAYLLDASRGTEYFEDISDVTASAVTSLGLNMKSLDTYRNDLSNLEKSIQELAPLSAQCDPNNAAGRPVVEWSQLSGIVDRFVKISSATLNGKKLSALGASSALDGTLSDNGNVVINDGVLKNMEQRIGNIMYDENIRMTISVTNVPVLGNKTIKNTRVQTAAAPEFYSVTDRNATAEINDSSTGAGDLTAKDTYGMAIDLWLRTNAPGMVVTLEGTTIYTEIPATGTDKNGNETNLYELDTGDGEMIDVYVLTEEDAQVWYDTNHNPVAEDLITEDNQPTPKTTQVVSGYEGENRIWEDWESMLKAGLIEEDSTTQGSGSCFIFYADPSEQVRILDLLDAFTVAFIDQSGKEVGKAVLNTEKAYAINGKVTVPLEVINGEEYTNAEGEKALGIMPLVQNEATWLTAIMYLDGMQLENQNVLAAGEIQGRLNIQFGSSVSLTSPNDEKLQLEYRTITASATAGDQTSPSDENIKFNYTGSAHAVEVTLTVDGEQPESISGFFQRIINATQGTGGDEVDFKKQDDGTWKATFGLTTPGTYALRNLIVDGVPYALDTCPTVLIEGLSVGLVTTDLKSGIHMTADRSLPVTVTAQIVTDTIMPAQVRAQFRSTDGKEANALMSYDNTLGRWVGTANITSSGTYTLEYLVMDGEFSELPEQYKTTLIVYLGMRTQVWGTQPVNEGAEAGDPYIFRGAVSIPVTAKVWDDTGTEIKSLKDVNLWYRAEGSYVDQGGMHATMTMDAATGYYTGTLVMNSPGIFRFHRLQNSAGSISNGTAPVFSAISENLPEFYDAKTDDYQIAIGGNGELKVQLAYSSSATVYADVVDGNGNTVLVRGAVGNEYDATVGGQQTTVNDFTFPVGDGSWTLTKLYFQNVYDKNTNIMYGITVEDEVRDKSYTMSVPSGISAYVVTTMTASLKDSNEDTFSGIEYNGSFMEEHVLSGLNLTIQDSKGNAIYHANDDGSVEGITGVTWTYQYLDATDVTYGGYDGASQIKKDIALTTGDHKTFAVPDQTFYLAGEYLTTSMTVAFADDTTKQLEIKPTIKVRSPKPTATITGITPTGSNPTKITYTTKSLSYGRGTEPTFTAATESGKTSTLNQATNTATVYALATADNDTQRHGSFTRPTATITVAGIDSSSKVTLILPAGSANAVTFTRTGNGAMTMTLGKTEQINTWKTNWGVYTHTLSAYYGHGQQTITTMTIVRNNVTYTVTLDKPIVINNPNSVNQ